MENNIKRFSSRKEVSSFLKEKGIDTLNWSEEKWFKINKGQAEIHMMALSETIYDAVNESTPKQLKAEEWHLPMLPEKAIYYNIEDKLKYCVGIHANTSYTVVGKNKKLTLEHASKIYDKCIKEVHSSVFEHCARAMGDVEYTASKSSGCSIRGGRVHPQYGWCYNLKGFIPLRYFIDNKISI